VRFVTVNSWGTNLTLTTRMLTLQWAHSTMASKSQAINEMNRDPLWSCSSEDESNGTTNNPQGSGRS